MPATTKCQNLNDDDFEAALRAGFAECTVCPDCTLTASCPRHWHPRNPITVREEPVQAVRNGSWEAQLWIDINDATALLGRIAAAADGTMVSRQQGDLLELAAVHDTQTAAEGTLRRWRALVSELCP